MKKKKATQAAVAFEEVDKDALNPIAEARWFNVTSENVWTDNEASWYTLDASDNGLFRIKSTGVSLSHT